MTKSRNSTFRLKFVQGWVDRDGRVHFYFRRAGYPRIRLPGLVGSAEFMAAYAAALGTEATPIGRDKRSKPGSVSAAIAAYYSSQSFRSLSGGTPAKRRAILERFREDHGHLALAGMPKRFIVALLDTMEPHSARNWLKALRGLLRSCVEHELCREDPTLAIRIKVPKSDGHHTWTEPEILQFEVTHPIGSKARLAFALLLYTAQRRGDVVRIGRQHISEQFRKWCDDAVLPPHCTAHGLRKAACRRLAEAGCSANEIAAISGHKTLREVQRYTDAADQARLARNAMARTATAAIGRKVG